MKLSYEEECLLQDRIDRMKDSYDRIYFQGSNYDNYFFIEKETQCRLDALGDRLWKRWERFERIILSNIYSSDNWRWEK